jgi:hypothetical protein
VYGSYILLLKSRGLVELGPVMDENCGSEESSGIGKASLDLQFFEVTLKNDFVNNILQRGE